MGQCRRWNEKVSIAAGAAVALIDACTGVWAQAYPTKPVRLIAPFPAGGSSDLLARILSQKLSESFRQQIVVDNRPGAGGAIGIFERFGKPTSNSIPTIIRGFKSSVTRRVNELRGTPGSPVWQRNYYEHVIRNEIDLEEIRQYIGNNPFKWLEDENHPANIEAPNRRGTMHRAPTSY